MLLSYAPFFRVLAVRTAVASAPVGEDLSICVSGICLVSAYCETARAHLRKICRLVAKSIQIGFQYCVCSLGDVPAPSLQSELRAQVCYSDFYQRYVYTVIEIL